MMNDVNVHNHLALLTRRGRKRSSWKRRTSDSASSRSSWSSRGSSTSMCAGESRGMQSTLRTGVNEPKRFWWSGWHAPLCEGFETLLSLVLKSGAGV
jgi:hypothetical protein